MKKKILTRAVCVMLSQEMYRQLSELTDQQEISVSDYIRFAVQERLNQTTTINNKNEEAFCLP
jgi:Arc/MetJ-type ribon-helix-helix transcriptional regulator